MNNGDKYKNCVLDETCVLPFRTVHQYYMFDVCNDEVQTISREIYNKLERGRKEQLHRPNGSQQIVCCIGDYKKVLQDGVSGLTFQITQMCNLKCDYCPHAQDGNQKMRSHANVRMSKEMAFQGIDFLAAHSGKRKAVDISFFGGEPLIEFGLIREIVLYAEKKLYDKQITFNISTNAVLLTEEKIDFFLNHKFCVGISLDGPEKINDKNRKDWGGRGTFCHTYRNFEKMKEKAAKTDSKIYVNAVLDKQCDLDAAEHFYEQIQSDKVIVMPSLVDDLSSTKKHHMTEKFYWKSTYLRFLVMLWLLGRIDEAFLPVAARAFQNEFRAIYSAFRNKKHTMSPVLRYQFDNCEESFGLYLNCDGNFYPTIGVNEAKSEFVIGHIHEGIDPDKIENLLRVASEYKDSCRFCPAAAYCRLGIVCCVEEKGITEFIKREYCDHFLELFYEVIGLSILEDENKQYDKSFSAADMPASGTKAVLQNIFRVIKRVTCKELAEGMIEIPLVSKDAGVSALDLVYILFELEKEYSIVFEADDILDYRFCCIQNILCLIQKKMGNC